MYLNSEPSGMEKSEIVSFFKDSTIFLTGGTGFLGQLFIEKLLRTCEVEKIYLLIRPKKGNDVKKRFKEVFKGANFELLKRLHPDFMSKLHLIEGDCCLPNLGLNQTDKEKIISEVNCVIHCAATVRFTEELRTATNINLRSVMDIIKLCKEMPNLKAAIYISTAFSNCVQSQIDETFYEPPLTSEKLFSLLEALDDNQLEKITPIILGDYPNTYAFTKAIAENVVRSEGSSLPIAVYRPSIVTATAKEPIPGWIDNVYGPTGLMLNSLLGVIHSVRGRPENTADLVPADYVINGALAILWELGTTDLEKVPKVPVYNFVSSVDCPIRWGEFITLEEKYGKRIPSALIFWHFFFTMRANKISHSLVVGLTHFLPAYIIDFICICMKKKAKLVKAYMKINKIMDAISYFTMNQWIFSNNNTQNLWLRMSNQDQKLFHFEMKTFNWMEYFKTYVKGARLYILKDPLDTVPAGKSKCYKLKIAHYLLIIILVFLPLIMLIISYILYIF